ncbi:MAG: COG1361 S-layer family protein [Methanosarcinaceae archaeon]
MRKLPVFLILLLILLLPTAQSYVETIPPNKWTFIDDYFTIYGSPEMVVSTSGNPEYSRGDSATVLIQVMNQGKILGFEAEDTPNDANEIALSKIEHQMEYSATVAVGVIAYLKPDGAPLDIKTPPQSAGTLVSGQVSQLLQFEIEVLDNATAGTYPLSVNLTYQYQKDVQVDGNATSNNIDYNMLYRNIDEKHTIFITIIEEADFEVTNVDSELFPDSSGILKITYKNIGDETASIATARLRLSNPLSSTDYTAFLGDMKPGDEVVAIFSIDVDPDASYKTYSIKTEIEYDDFKGNTRISDTIYVPAQVREPDNRGKMIQNPLLIGAAIIMILLITIVLASRMHVQKKS